MWSGFRRSYYVRWLRTAVSATVGFVRDALAVEILLLVAAFAIGGWWTRGRVLDVANLVYSLAAAVLIIAASLVVHLVRAPAVLDRQSTRSMVDLRSRNEALEQRLAGFEGRHAAVRRINDIVIESDALLEELPHPPYPENFPWDDYERRFRDWAARAIATIDAERPNMLLSLRNALKEKDDPNAWLSPENDSRDQQFRQRLKSARFVLYRCV